MSTVPTDTTSYCVTCHTLSITSMRMCVPSQRHATVCKAYMVMNCMVSQNHQNHQFLVSAKCCITNLRQQKFELKRSKQKSLALTERPEPADSPPQLSRIFRRSAGEPARQARCQEHAVAPCGCTRTHLAQRTAGGGWGGRGIADGRGHAAVQGPGMRAGVCVPSSSLRTRQSAQLQKGWPGRRLGCACVV